MDTSWIYACDKNLKFLKYAEIKNWGKKIIIICFEMVENLIWKFSEFLRSTKMLKKRDKMKSC